MSKIFLSVVIPSYDELSNLKKGVLDRVDSFLSKQKYEYEVLVVDDGSGDGSVEFVENFSKKHPEFRIVKNSHTGKAGAVTAGVLASKGEYVLFTDMDQATPIEEIGKLLPFFQKGADIVIGSRKTKRKGAPLVRQFISLSAIVLRKTIVGLSDISDTQCGFKMFTHDASQKLFTRISEIHNGFKNISGSAVTAGFDIELLHLARKEGYSIVEVPVNWLYVETRRVNPITDSIEGVLDLLRIKANDIAGKYKI